MDILVGPIQSQRSFEEERGRSDKEKELYGKETMEAEVGVMRGDGPKNSVASRSWKNQGNGSLFEPLEEISLGQPILNLCLPEL